MFVRVKKVGPYQYLQIAQNRREGKRVKQSIVATLGRLDKLTASGAIDQLLRSAARFAERLMVLTEHANDAPRRHRRLGRPGTDLRTPVARDRLPSGGARAARPPATITSMSNARCS